MIVRISIENLVIVERAEFTPGSALTAITGETGAGKTLLATAISLLFGGPAQATHVGPCSEQAWVEGEFEVDESFWELPQVKHLAQLRPSGESILVLARRVDANGRSRALAWGRTISKDDLAAAGSLLLTTAGQHMQVKLRSADFQRSVLDGAGSADHQSLLTEMRSTFISWQKADTERLQIEQNASDFEQQREQVLADLARLEAVSPSVEEEAELRACRDRIRHRHSILTGLAKAQSFLDSSDANNGGAIDLVGEAYSQLEVVSQLDPNLSDLAQRLLDVQEYLTDIASEVSGRLDRLAEDGSSIDDIEERLGIYDELKRSFGGTVESVLATWETLRARCQLLNSSEMSIARARELAKEARLKALHMAEQLTAARCALADQLSGEISELLHELGMSSSVFRIAVTETELTGLGADCVELQLSPARNIEPLAISQVASGGELSRIALALLVATHARGNRPQQGAILFDEIDAGIGGHTAHAIASMLHRLSEHQQVIVITHLPQVAARAETHSLITKVDDGGAVRTNLTMLTSESEVELELMRMLGAEHDDDAAHEHVRQLRGSSTRFSLSVDKLRASPP